jgi:oxygen-independent coproporphyrinogen III oxidase
MTALPDSFSIYIHIPFCVRRCPYCAFYSTEITGSEQLARYPELIQGELEMRAPSWENHRLESIFFGGGTPSLITPDGISRIIEKILTIFDSTPSPEFTLEANPGTLNTDLLQGFISAGINRLSLGIQSLSDKRLTFLGRIHDRAQALQALEFVRERSNITLSVDLMAGTPLETTQIWDAELDALFPFIPDGISMYSLTVEEGTQLAHRQQGGEEVYLGADETVDLLQYIGSRLQMAGYRHYEVSNWALPGKECRHNQHYWKRGSYLGLGPSAHSFDGKERTWNRPDLSLYQKALDAGLPPPSESEALTETDIRTEWVYLRVRQSDGLNLEEYSRLFGEPPSQWQEMLDQMAKQGLGSFDGVQFQPTDRGLLLADEIALRLL